MISATSFTLVGVVNKFLTVLLNVLLWDKHSTPSGLIAVCICLLAGIFYQQAPRRDEDHRIETTISTIKSEIEMLETSKDDGEKDTEPLLNKN